VSDHTATRWLIRGRVQGVGFRWFVLRQAEELQVVGWARNLPDGQVEVVGAGSTEAIAEFERRLRRGPRLSRVDHVETSSSPHDINGLNTFDIR